MNQIKLAFIALFLCAVYNLNAQESDDDYIEFNDRKNTVHGVYMGLAFHYGKINKVDTYSTSFKVAYVANQQFEVGFVGVGFYSDVNLPGPFVNNRDLVGAYGGLHLEPILFSKSKVNLSFPLLIGGGGIDLLEENLINNDDFDHLDDERWKAIFVVEPGINALYNISRYLQLEAGIKYRFSSKVDFQPDYSLSRIDGFSAGIGIKVGVFNMGRNRYKKN
ncbi:hypothetical protein [Jejuia spongiicola]|uniref:Outer membrane protein beta-barrel domain-containing protein n=1 Tax=Jejuia spongiicola TaxID=2942207 RepID=A0ABT0QDM5_9FLAO|nr:MULTISPECIES: hypothetical protein [Flavobacteriaceae]MCL6295095.1 hypothetical protein [Jejuia spongiicola]PIA77646.1 hypothetical protein BFR04_09415 [Gaetbulibacter sp. 4G1]